MKDTNKTDIKTVNNINTDKIKLYSKNRTMIFSKASVNCVVVTEEYLPSGKFILENIPDNRFSIKENTIDNPGNQFKIRLINKNNKTQVINKNQLVATLYSTEDKITKVTDELISPLVNLITESDFKTKAEESIFSEEFHRQQLTNFLMEYTDIFSTKLIKPAQALGIEHSIELSDETPIKCPSRRYSTTARLEIEKQIKEMMNMGVITPSDSPWSAPVVLSPKQDGTLRFCVDYRRLNAVTIKDATPLPNIQDLLESLKGKKYFSTIDLSSGYWQIPMNRKHRRMTAFRTHMGLYEFLGMPFGLSNAGPTFQKWMNGVLIDINGVICLSIS